MRNNGNTAQSAGQRNFGWALGAGILITAAQILVCLAFVPADKSPAYLSLNNWDSFHYQDIAERGYHLKETSGEITAEDVHENRANVAYFPAYPMLVRALKLWAGMPVPWGLLLVAQTACAWFWALFLVALRRRGLTAREALGAAGIVAVYPASFFLVTGYSESLFLAGLLGFVLFSEEFLDHGRPASFALAALHGFALTAGRLVGIPLAGFPVAREAGRKLLGERPRWVPAFALAALASLGAIAFFAYSAWRFGEWNLYLKLQTVGWKNYPDYLAILNPLSYVPHFFFEHTVDSFSRSSVLLCGVLAVVAWRRERKSGRAAARRLGLYFAAFMMFYVSLSGKARQNMDSMVRYVLPVFVLMILAFAEHHVPRPGAESKRGRFAFYALLGLSAAIQLWFIYRFLRGRWVA